jgi:DNA-binding NtrC family response regulator
VSRFDDDSSATAARRGRRVTPAHADGVRLRDIERAAIERTLEATGNNQSAAARILGIARPTLIRKLKSYRARARD